MPQAQTAGASSSAHFPTGISCTSSDVTDGYNTTAQLNFIRDGFHNTSIAVVTDSNLDGVINGRDASGGFPGGDRRGRHPDDPAAHH
jgi:hypothetical protein